MTKSFATLFLLASIAFVAPSAQAQTQIQVPTPSPVQSSSRNQEEMKARLVVGVVVAFSVTAITTFSSIRKQKKEQEKLRSQSKEES